MNIAIIGYGKMGKEIEKTALERGHNIVCVIDNESDWETKNELIVTADVAIEFSMPKVAPDNIKKCFDKDIPVVCGTTGWNEHENEIRERCLNDGKALFYAPNFSIGMNFMFMINKMLARFAQHYRYELSIRETHHIHKLDMPSGTAVKLANDIIANNSNYSQWALDASKEGILPVISIREGEVFGIHNVKAVSECDEINISHQAFSRKGFAVGAVTAAEFLIGKKGLYNMNDLLNENINNN